MTPLDALRRRILLELDDNWMTPSAIANRLGLGHGVGRLRVALVVERLAVDSEAEIQRRCTVLATRSAASSTSITTVWAKSRPRSRRRSDPRTHKTPALAGVSRGGRYWARTSDPQLVELVLSQLS